VFRLKMFGRGRARSSKSGRKNKIIKSPPKTGWQECGPCAGSRARTSVSIGHGCTTKISRANDTRARGYYYYPRRWPGIFGAFVRECFSANCSYTIVRYVANQFVDLQMWFSTVKKIYFRSFVSFFFLLNLFIVDTIHSYPPHLAALAYDGLLVGNCFVIIFVVDVVVIFIFSPSNSLWCFYTRRAPCGARAHFSNEWWLL
jgi:hypothetical protein